MANWTLSTWPVEMDLRRAKGFSNDPSVNEKTATLVNWSAKYGSIGLSANWLGDDRFLGTAFFGDSLNEKGLSCSTLALVGTGYQEKSPIKTNIFAGLFCNYVALNFESVLDLEKALPKIAIYGPDALAQHFIVRDAAKRSLIVEVLGGKQYVYLDENDGVQSFGVTANEPTFDWHLQNIQHYEWKRGLARQAIATPGNFYPEERVLRTHMIKSGMQQQGLMDSTEDFKMAFALTAQVLNTVSVPQGDQYGTDTGDDSGEGSAADHTVWAVIRDHAEPALFWRDSANPTFRGLRLRDADLSPGAPQKIMALQIGPLYVDMVDSLTLA
eukprot:gene29114-38175_t